MDTARSWGYPSGTARGARPQGGTAAGPDPPGPEPWHCALLTIAGATTSSGSANWLFAWPETVLRAWNRGPGGSPQPWPFFSFLASHVSQVLLLSWLCPLSVGHGPLTPVPRARSHSNWVSGQGWVEGCPFSPAQAGSDCKVEMCLHRVRSKSPPPTMSRLPGGWGASDLAVPS